MWEHFLDQLLPLVSAFKVGINSLETMTAACPLIDFLNNKSKTMFKIQNLDTMVENIIKAASNSEITIHILTYDLVFLCLKNQQNGMFCI